MDFPPSVCHELMVEKRLPTHVRAPLVIKPFLVLFMVSVCDISWAGRFEGIYFPRCQCRTSDQQRPSETVSLALSCLPRSCNPSSYQPFLLSSFLVCLFACFCLRLLWGGLRQGLRSPGWPWTPHPPAFCAFTPGFSCSLTHMRKWKPPLCDLQGWRVHAVRVCGEGQW